MIKDLPTAGLTIHQVIFTSSKLHLGTYRIVENYETIDGIRSRLTHHSFENFVDAYNFVLEQIEENKK